VAKSANKNFFGASFIVIVRQARNPFGWDLFCFSPSGFHLDTVQATIFAPLTRWIKPNKKRYGQFSVGCENLLSHPLRFFKA